MSDIFRAYERTRCGHVCNAKKLTNETLSMCETIDAQHAEFVSLKRNMDKLAKGKS